MTLHWSEGRPPDPADYIALREACGLYPRGTRAAEVGMPNSLHTVTLHDGDRLIGMGRVIGDGGTAAQITDICVAAEYRRRGLASGIMTRLMDWCDANLPDTCFVNLVADPGAETLYAKAGFTPTKGQSMGYRVGQSTRPDQE